MEYTLYGPTYVESTTVGTGTLKVNFTIDTTWLLSVLQNVHTSPVVVEGQENGNPHCQMSCEVDQCLLLCEGTTGQWPSSGSLHLKGTTAQLV